MTRRSILTESQARRDVKVTSIGKRSGKGRGMAVRKREKSQSLTDVGNNEESSPSKIKKRSDEEMEDFCEKKPLSTKKGVKKFGQRGRSCNLEKKLASLCIDAGNTVEIDGTGFTFQRQLYCVLNDTFSIFCIHFCLLTQLLVVDPCLIILLVIFCFLSYCIIQLSSGFALLVVITFLQELLSLLLLRMLM